MISDFFYPHVAFTFEHFTKNSAIQAYFVVKTSLNLTFGAIGSKLSVIHRFTEKHTNSLNNTFRHSTGLNLSV